MIIVFYLLTVATIYSDDTYFLVQGLSSKADSTMSTAKHHNPVLKNNWHDKLI